MTERRATPASVGVAVGKLIPSAVVLQVGATRLWLLDGGEPFCEVELGASGSALGVWFSVHCSPGYAGGVGALLAGLADSCVVSPVPFVQDHLGLLRRGAAAEAYWQYYREIKPLLSLVFGPPG